MRIKLRFTLHFIVGVLLCLISMGVTAMISIEFLLPAVGIAESSRYYDLIVIFIFLLHLIICCIIFSIYFVHPIWFILTWISNLTQGIYGPPGTKNKIYNKNNRLRKPFQLYEEVIINIHQLANQLKKSEGERARLEESKRSWIAGISHDLKTPLTTVIGYSALLLNQDYEWTQEEISGFVKEIQTKGQYIEDLIGDLNISNQMEAAHMQIPLRREETNIVDFMQRLVAAVVNDSKADGYELSFYSSEENIKLSLDQKLIYRALMNLLINAIEHNPTGTGIHISVIKEEKSIEIRIADNGVGMDESALDNLFSEYRNTSENRSRKFGTGLGMSIASKLIAAHGGSLTVKSRLTEGTIFQITFPYEKL